MVRFDGKFSLPFYFRKGLYIEDLSPSLKSKTYMGKSPSMSSYSFCVPGPLSSGLCPPSVSLKGSTTVSLQGPTTDTSSGPSFVKV